MSAGPKSEVNDIAASDEDGLPIDFFTATSLGMLDVVQAYICRGQNVDEQNSHGWTALMYAGAFQKNDLVSYLLSVGANVGLSDNNGNSFLTVIIKNENSKSFSLLEKYWLSSKRAKLTDHDEDVLKRILSVVNARDSKGNTPIMIAAMCGKPEMVEVLIRFGADITLTNFKGETALVLAISNGHQTTASVLKFLGGYTVEELLIDLNLVKYTDLFKGISFEELLLLDESDLKFLGLRLLGPRKKIILAIEKWNTIKTKIQSRGHTKKSMSG